MQQRFWPDPQPLVERLGRDFFRNLPERPGVYLMRDAGGTVLYVGKAKNLRKRLGSYRVANPERMPRRHLRLLRAVVRIDLQECEDEQAALTRESELLRTLKPRFNRAGTWPGKVRFLAWKTSGDAIGFAITESPVAGWDCCGPMGAGAFPLCALLTRLLFLAMNRAARVDQLPEGWAAGRIAAPVRVRSVGEHSSVLLEARTRLAALLVGEVDDFCRWIENRRSPISTSFERGWLESEFESLHEYFKPSLKRVRQSIQACRLTARLPETSSYCV